MHIEDLRYAIGSRNLEGTPREIRLGSRDRGRLLVVDRALKKYKHSTVGDLANFFSAGDVIVLNRSKRIPGVLRGRTHTGGQVEFRFVDLNDDHTGLCRIFPMHDVRTGDVVGLRAGGRVRVLEMDITKYGLCRVAGEDATLREELVRQGTPILGFFYDGLWTTEHLNPYYADEEGSVESPLAGLHFTRELVAGLERAGVEVCFVTLHSVGSWLPFLEERIEAHEMWPEVFRVPEQTAEAVARARENGGKVVACGSTSLRALESAASGNGGITACEGRTNLYIQAGYEFRVVDGFFTNFHQYQTSLMVLDVAFGGEKLVMNAYREAARLLYSFYEFGDAVLYL